MKSKRVQDTRWSLLFQSSLSLSICSATSPLLPHHFSISLAGILFHLAGNRNHGVFQEECVVHKDLSSNPAGHVHYPGPVLIPAPNKIKVTSVLLPRHSITALDNLRRV
ncbi:hypothetical protein ACMFMG_007532 [Clarireedia jacksonii]